MLCSWGYDFGSTGWADWLCLQVSLETRHGTFEMPKAPSVPQEPRNLLRGPTQPSTSLPGTLPPWRLLQAQLLETGPGGLSKCQLIIE